MNEPSGWWWVFEYVWLSCIFLLGCNVALFFFWFMGMQVIAGMIAGYRVCKRTHNLRPGWGLLTGGGIGFLMAVMALIMRTVALESIPRKYPAYDYVEPTFDFVVPPLTAIIVVVATWLLCHWWPRLKALVGGAKRRSG